MKGALTSSQPSVCRVLGLDASKQPNRPKSQANANGEKYDDVLGN